MGRTPCCDKNGVQLKKGPWTAEEDEKLIDYIHKHGHGKWRTVPKNSGLKRCGKSCRLRWTNYLRPDIKRGRFSHEEEEAMIQLHSILGNKWSVIAARLPGRTDNEIKNYWNTHVRKKLLRMGIDPVTHGPRLDLLNLSIFAPPLDHAQFNNPNLVNQQALLPQYIQESLLSYPQLQNQFQCFQENQLQGTIQELQASTTSIAPLFNVTNSMQANVNQYSPNTTSFDCPNSLPNLYSTSYFNNEILFQNQIFQFEKNNNKQNLRFGSRLEPTPSSSPPPLISSSLTYDSPEDERGNYGSHMIMKIANSMAAGGFM